MSRRGRDGVGRRAGGHGIPEYCKDNHLCRSVAARAQRLSLGLIRLFSRDICPAQIIVTFDPRMYVTHPVILPQKSAREDTVMGTPRGDRSLRWKMPPFFLSDRRRWRDGRTNGVGRQSGSGDVTRTLSLSLSLSLPPSAAWSMECADFPWPSSSLVRSSLLFHSIGEMSDTIQIAATLPPTGTGRRRERERRRRRRREEGGGRRHLFHGPLLCEARFSDHSFILLASPPASQHPQSART